MNCSTRWTLEWRYWRMTGKVTWGLYTYTTAMFAQPPLTYRPLIFPRYLAQTFRLLSLSCSNLSSFPLPCSLSCQPLQGTSITSQSTRTVSDCGRTPERKLPWRYSLPQTTRLPSTYRGYFNSCSAVCHVTISIHSTIRHHRPCVPRPIHTQKSPQLLLSSVSCDH